MDSTIDTSPTRRRLLAGGAALATLAALPAGSAMAQPAARWRRYNVESPQGQRMLRSYQVAIDRMLRLKPTDPRNWYRIAFTHLLDCPHMNWWLYPWHRGFVGWMEQIVREISGDADFAFPYWDWTASPQVPVAARSGLLTPSAPPFIKTIGAFADAFKGTLTAAGYFRNGSAQAAQLAARGFSSEADVWSQIEKTADPNFPVFFPAPASTVPGNGGPFPQVRNPDPVLDCSAGPAVASSLIATAMRTPDYNSFSSGPCAQHSGMGKYFGLLEQHPHNLVHNDTGGIVSQVVNGSCGMVNNVGGFMQAFLSPVDPIFFLHHSNLDRLWDAWTRLRGGGPNTLPQPAQSLAAWSNEPFLFFCDSAGKPVTKTRAGDYARIGAFDYDYQPGSVGAVAGRALAAPRGTGTPRTFVGTRLVATSATGGGAARVAVRLEPALVALAAPTTPSALVAQVTLTLPMHRRGQQFPVYVDAGSGPVEIGRIALFGHVMPHGPMTYVFPLGDALAAVQAKGALKANGSLVFSAAAPGGAAPPMAGMEMTASGPTPLAIDAVTIQAF